MKTLRNLLVSLNVLLAVSLVIEWIHHAMVTRELRRLRK